MVYSSVMHLGRCFLWEGIMTKSEFVAICAERTIEPSLALENEKVREALRLDDVYWLIAILDNEF